MTLLKRPSRRTAVVAGLILALLGLGGGVYAATLGPSYELTVTDGRTAFAPGQAGGYRVDVDRIRGHGDQVTLRVRGLPRGAQHRWVLSDGRALPKRRFGIGGGRWKTSREAVSLDPRHTRAFLVVSAGADTADGQATPTIVAKSGRLVRQSRRAITIGALERRTANSSTSPAPGLAASSEPSRSVGVTVAPGRRSVVQSDLTRFALELTRSAATPAPSVTVDGLPSGATASFDPANPIDASRATMTIETTKDTPTGTYDLTVTATAGDARSSAATTLVVERLRDFTIAGSVEEPLSLGTTRAIPLTLTNPYDFDLSVEELGIAVSTTNAGCDAATNFAVRQVGLAEPIVLPPGEHALGDLVDAADLPEVTWRNLDEEQDACIGAPLTFRYSGLATKR